MRTPSLRSPDTEAFGRLKQQVIARTGHHYYEDKEDLLWERVRKRIRGGSVEAYLERLDDADTGPSEWMALEAELTIGETYFFRYPEQFQALRDTILPDLFEQRAAERRLRIWSAGCATGAEPYSLAILLHDVLGDALPQWRITILGTDINDTFLAAAREARFGHWALRSLTPEQRAAWFVQEERAWRLRAPYRSMVRFQRGNLLDLLGSSAPLELVEFDLILCRNVLIYFHPQKMAEVAAALIARLRPQGWLLVGHAEPNPEFSRFAEAVSLPGTVAYQPPGTARIAAPGEGAAQAWSPLPAPAAELVLPPAIAAPAPATPAFREPTPAARAQPPQPPQDFASEVRALADMGDFRGAQLKGREALQEHPADPVLNFYAGLVEQALGHLASAEDALRRAAYLDPRFIMAHYHLGLVRLARGKVDAGRKAIAAAAQLAGTLAVEERLAEGAGLTAGEMRELARVQLEGASGA